MDCPDCGYVLSPFDKECPRCEKLGRRIYGEPSPMADPNWRPALPPVGNPEPLPAVPVLPPAPIIVSPQQGCLWVGYVFAVISLFFCPPGFGIAGLVIGALNVSRGHAGNGIAQIVLSVVFGTIGTIWGMISGFYGSSQ